MPLPLAGRPRWQRGLAAAESSDPPRRPGRRFCPALAVQPSTPAASPPPPRRPCARARAPSPAPVLAFDHGICRLCACRYPPKCPTNLPLRTVLDIGTGRFAFARLCPCPCPVLRARAALRHPVPQRRWHRPPVVWEHPGWRRRRCVGAAELHAASTHLHCVCATGVRHGRSTAA